MEKGLNEKTIAAYSNDLMRFGLFLEKKNTAAVSDIDTRLILKYLIHLRDQGLSARTRARHLVSLRGFFKFLTIEKIISSEFKTANASLLDVNENIILANKKLCNVTDKII